MATPDPHKLVHLQLTANGTILLGVPDKDTNLITTIEMTPATARQLGEELFKAGAMAGEAHPETN